MDHIGWIDEILPQLTKLKELEIAIYPCQVDRIGQHVQQPIDTNAVALRRMVGLPVTSLVEIYPYFSVFKNGGLATPAETYERNQAPVAVWTKKDGWQQK